MTITELLLSNPGVELTLAYNETLCVFSIKAEKGIATANTTVKKWMAGAAPGHIEEAIKRAMEAVR